MINLGSEIGKFMKQKKNQIVRKSLKESRSCASKAYFDTRCEVRYNCSAFGGKAITWGEDGLNGHFSKVNKVKESVF